MHHLGDIPAGVTIPFPFTTYATATGASITMSGLAVTDIEVYKGNSMTQRSSDNGYALMDTDGIDIDSVTGFHGFSIDLSDNSDAGFYAAGSFYTVLVNAITVDGQTVVFIAGTFRIRVAENTSGTPVVDVGRFGGTTVTGRDIGASVLLSGGTGTGQVTLTSGILSVNTVNLAGQTVAAITTVTFPATVASTTNISAGTITTVTNLTNAPTNGDFTATMKASINTEADTALADYDAPTNAEMVARTLAAASYATAANQTTILTNIATVDTVVDAILVDTAEIGVAGAGLTAIILPSNGLSNITDISLSGDFTVGGRINAITGISAGDLAVSTNNLSWNSSWTSTVGDAAWDEAVDGSVTARQSMRLQNSAAGGKTSGMGTTNAKLRDLADTKDRIDATVDADGNRAAVTRDLT